MNRSFLQIEQSGWWVIVILLVSAALSYFLYAKKEVPWNSIQNWVLFGFRTLAIGSILFLLLDPSIKNVVSTIQEPTIALAIDNSQSVTARGGEENEIKSKIEQLKEEIESQGIDLQTFQLQESDTITFNQNTTRLSGLLAQVDEEMEDVNWVGTILLSDGIYNRGASPLYRNFITPIFTIGMGDSIPPKDINISRTQYNKVAYKGNSSPIRLEISQEGYLGKSIDVSLTENGVRIDSKSLELTSEVQEVEFLIELEEEGLRHLVAYIPNDPEESTHENNRADIFLEVIDGRQKVLIVASSPHPDIKAIRSSLAETDNYTTDLYIPAVDTESPTEIYDAVIFHGAFSNRINYQPKENPGIWYILSNESPINTVNQSLSYLQINRRGGQPDKVSGSFNQNFSKFKVDNTEIFEEYPPIEVPFGEYSTSGPSEVLMYQKLGSITTSKPLMVVFDDGSQKSAVLMGQNIWRWKLQEAAINNNSQQFQNFITKTIQFLSVKNDKKQFRFNTRSSTFSDSSPILFDTEVYNDIYERSYGNVIQISIRGENEEAQSFEFVNSEFNSTFRAPALSPGIYSYSATVQIGDKTLRDNGEFLVENVNPEFLNLTANHRLLRNLSAKTGGEFVAYQEIDQLPEIIRNQEFKAVIKSDEDYQPLIESWWWFLIIFLLFSTEWVLRRYWGGY